MPPRAIEPRPIFILGISPRCGTNYLSDLLTLHPDCARFPLFEDFFVESTEPLDGFARSVVSRMESRFDVDPGVEAHLKAALGYGLVHLARSQCADKRIVLKTPSPRRLSRFFEYFPDSDLVVLVRDGRSCVESIKVSFGAGQEQASRLWASGADEIIRFRETAPSGGGRRGAFLLYEDLFSKNRETLEGLLQALGLDRSRYPFDEADRVPVRGSVFYNGKSETWKPRERRPDFRPLRRFESWTEADHAVFRELAGRQQLSLGYPL